MGSIFVTDGETVLTEPSRAFTKMAFGEVVVFDPAAFAIITLFIVVRVYAVHDGPFLFYSILVVSRTNEASSNAKPKAINPT